MLVTGQCQTSGTDTWLLLCWHWVGHVPRAASGSRVTRGLGNIRGISWCHPDQDPGGWLESEEDLTTISMSRVYIGDQEFTGVKEARSAQYSAFQHLEAVCRVSLTHQNTPLYTTSHGALNFERNTVIELFKCPSVYSLSLSGNLIFIITKPNWISIDGRCQRVAARWAPESTIRLATLQFEIILV